MVDITKSIKVKESIRAKWRKALHKNVTRNSFFENHPLEEMKEALRPLGVTIVMEDGEEWQGFICGSTGSTTFNLGYDGGIVDNAVLVYNWYGKEVHGLNKVEINSYIS